MGPDLLFLPFPASFSTMSHSEKQWFATLSAPSRFSVFGNLVTYTWLFHFIDNITKALIDKKVVCKK